jgi:hypothetical protein
MRAEVADHGAQRSRNEYADPVAEVRLGSKATFCPSANYFRSSPTSGRSRWLPACLKGATSGHSLRHRFRTFHSTTHLPSVAKGWSENAAHHVDRVVLFSDASEKGSSELIAL